MDVFLDEATNEAHRDSMEFFLIGGDKFANNLVRVFDRIDVADFLRVFPKPNPKNAVQHVDALKRRGILVWLFLGIASDARLINTHVRSSPKVRAAWIARFETSWRPLLAVWIPPETTSSFPHDVVEVLDAVYKIFVYDLYTKHRYQIQSLCLRLKRDVATRQNRIRAMEWISMIQVHRMLTTQTQAIAALFVLLVLRARIVDGNRDDKLPKRIVPNTIIKFRDVRAVVEDAEMFSKTLAAMLAYIADDFLEPRLKRKIAFTAWCLGILHDDDLDFLWYKNKWSTLRRDREAMHDDVFGDDVDDESSTRTLVMNPSEIHRVLEHTLIEQLRVF